MFAVIFIVFIWIKKRRKIIIKIISKNFYNRIYNTTSPPSNMIFYKGEFHSILTRDFIETVHTNPLALEFWAFLNGTHVPDEHLYPSLVRVSELSWGKARVVSTYD